MVKILFGGSSPQNISYLADWLPELGPAQPGQAQHPARMHHYYDNFTFFINFFFTY